uniref:NUDIX domain-containing protein n=1 Tax=Waltera intestinalis TaxID=2606635 RepID=UPI003FF08543
MLLRGNSEPKEANLHRIFGKEENVAYLDRRGAYIIPIKGEEIGIVETPKGLFLLGGGIDGDETDNQCIIRECIEEAGYQVEIKERVCSAETYYEHPTIGFFHPIQVYYSGKLVKKVKEPVEQDHVFRWVKYEDLRGKMCLEMQNWAVEQVWNMC